MHFINFLNRYFDAVIEHEFDPDIIGTNNTGKDVTQIWIYEKGNDCEPLLILKESWWYTETKKPNYWLVGNIYSELVHGSEYSEAEFRELVRAGKITSEFS
ncbi:hypothetical protein [Pantoea sp. CFSAN033090]|uniref:hypothetical protein n=1 Tax=Pantoea sp. CFSAN033090 TaxID=1690502 RepID=UPI000691A679|nr:hypothetical protein [Pantoea sp. CFSAN033090]KOA68696.1 cobalamin biosynthesis protein CbiX [Pantoea sp. CFSAN033090]